jgi:tetratricopeptide (TPR) repeat protein
VPEIAAFGSRYLITLEAVDVQNQKIIARRQEEAESKDKVIAALGKAALRLRTQVGESLSSLNKYNAPLDLATTSSLDALQAYRTGQTLYRSGKRHEAVSFLERAVELDPQFCSAYGMLGAVYHSLGDDEASKENFAKAFVLKDRRLTQEENFRTTAFYHGAITGNLEKEIAILELYKQVYPRSASAHSMLGIAYATLGRTQEALQEFYWAIDDSRTPTSAFYSNASQALLILGRFDEAKKILDQWKQKGSFTPFQTVFRYRIASFEGDSATMDRLAREIPPDDVFWLQMQVDLAFYRGEIHKVRLLTETLVEQQKHANRMENVSFELARDAWLESYVGNHAFARTLCRQAAEASQQSPVGLVHCAWALGAAGELNEAETLAAKLDQLRPEDTFIQKVSLPQIRSVIVRERGDAFKAVDLLTPSTQYPNGMAFYHLARAYLAAGENAKAAVEFEKLIGHRGWPEWELFSPLARLGLARAYAKQGEREKSRKAYDDFFTTWKDADPNIPILLQAKAEFKKLQATTSTIASASGNKR